MTRSLRPASLLLAGALLAPVAASQDSVANTLCESDALTPWDDASAAFGSEQKNAYIVDLAPAITVWGMPFGVAPLAKATRANPAFNTNLISAQALSRRQLVNAPFASGSYQVWNAAGAGIHNDPSLNDVPGSDTAPCLGNQLGFAFAEFDTTQAGFSYNGIVGGVINLLPSNPSRLYVTRLMAAVNGCDGTTDAAQFGMGTVDETGLIHTRADNNNSPGGCATILAGNYWWQVRSLQRNGAVRNVVSGSYPAFADASDPVVSDTTVPITTHNTPGTMPASVTGGSALVMGTNFDKQFVTGSVGGATTTYTTHLGAGATDQRGAVGYTTDAFPALGGTHGVVGHLAKPSSGGTDRINLFGVNAAGVPQTKLVITLPAVITDNSNGATNIAGSNEFDHYHGAIAFRGGNSQVALGVDQAGNLLVAAEVDHPDTSTNDWGVNYIAVARVTPALAVSWTMAGYNYGPTGKAVLSGPGGTPIAQMVQLGLLTGGSPAGPSVSAPMIDSVGNVYFLSTIELLGSGDFASGLVRAVYDPATFSYELDLVLKSGDVFPGQNSDRDWLITLLKIADSSAVSPGTAWSGNINEMAHGGQSVAGLPTNDPRTLGGLVLSASVMYDVDDNGQFESCFDLVPGPDQTYNVLLYVGHRLWEELGAGLAGTGGLVPRFTGEGALLGNDLATLNLSQAKPNTFPFLVIGLSQINAPFKGGTLVPALQFLLNMPPTDGTGAMSLSAPWPAGLPSCIDLYFQYVIPDAAAVKGFALSNAVHVRTP
jgi:hypothetical protein